MSYRNGNRRNFSGGNYGGSMGRNMSPWDNQNSSGGNFGALRNHGNGGMNADALTLANNLLNNLLRNQNPPSLLDLPRGGSNSGGIAGNRGLRQATSGNNNRSGNNRNNRRGQGGGFIRGTKNVSNAKQGGGVRKQNAFDRAKKLLAKNSNKNQKDTTSDDNNEKLTNESAKEESVYADVPNDMFYCHLCKKHMWDSNSFENHIKGRTHMMMREGIEESYRLKANMIRQEAKLAEQLKLIELDRLKRIGKSKARHPREYCTMCDLNFHGHLSAHRKSEGHLALKKFLHPTCIECDQEFATRIEYDTHLLTPCHLKEAAEHHTKVGEKLKNNLTILKEEDELKDIKKPSKKKKEVEVKKETEGDEEDTGEEKKENGETVEEEKKEGDDVDATAENAETKEEDDDEELELIEDPEDCILDYHSNDEIPIDVETKIPKYNWQRAVGCSLIRKLDCFECLLCGKFFDSENTAEVHTRTMNHHRQFIKFINDKSSDTRIAQKRAAAALENTERKKRKLEESETSITDENKADGGDENNEETDAKPEVTGDESELYDPSEATGEDDAEANDNIDEEEQTNDQVEVKQEDKSDDVNGDQATKENSAKKVEETVVEQEIQKESKSEVNDDKSVDQNTTSTVVEQKKTNETSPMPKVTTPVQQKNSPQNQAAQRNTPYRAGNQAKGTPRGRGRGRYNRY